MSKYTFEEVKAKILKFQSDRGWDPTPSSLAKSIIIESAELLEHFQWDHAGNTEWEAEFRQKDQREVAYEVADIFWFMIAFCEKTGIDLLDAAILKGLHNEKKYPVEKILADKSDEFYFEQKKKYRRRRKY
jgi:dCTP diphosphatase